VTFKWQRPTRTALPLRCGSKGEASYHEETYKELIDHIDDCHELTLDKVQYVFRTFNGHPASCAFASLTNDDGDHTIRLTKTHSFVLILNCGLSPLK
jgi:hypothetical protein